MSEGSVYGTDLQEEYDAREHAEMMLSLGYESFFDYDSFSDNIFFFAFDSLLAYDDS